MVREVPLRVKRALPVVLLGAAGSQAGHLLAYEMRYRAAAAAMQSQGAHAYFPATVQVLGGCVGSAGLAALLVIGAARLLGRGGSPRRRSPMEFLPLLFVLQLGFFAGQETAEALAAGAATPDAASLILWGAAGQLPAALAGALALAWLGTRVEAAVTSLCDRPVSLRSHRLRPPRLLPGAPQLIGAPSQASISASRKRGPPLLIRD
jgi:hypothetical protein